MNPRLVKGFIITTFVTLYLVVSVISTIHVIEFFRLSNPQWLAVSLAIAFEIGAAASLASLITLEKMNKSLVWTLFFTLTAMQMMGNTYYAYTNLENFQGWVELFGLVDEELIAQKRILSIISGAILPLVALGFIKALVDYIKPDPSDPVLAIEQANLIKEEPKVETLVAAVEEPKVETPVAAVEEPKVETPAAAVEEPKVETVVETVAIEEPKVETVAIEEPKVEIPIAAVEKPIVEEINSNEEIAINNIEISKDQEGATDGEKKKV